MNNQNYKFEFSLEVLNHLGRGLYRNFATVVAEAVSNCWDADATEVRITIHQENRTMTIRDNGKGMSEDDFRNKFLKVGYSRRNDESNESTRKVLGRKGIGKLALLSVSGKVTIVTKKDNMVTGGVIDNAELDKEIKADGEYSLYKISNEQSQLLKTVDNGTIIKFESIKDSINNPSIIKKYLATLFNFSISSPNEIFDIYVNDEKVDEKDLKDLNKKTQFLWNLDNDVSINRRFINLKNYRKYGAEDDLKFEHNNREYLIMGFIASVEKPSDIKIHGTGGDFKAGLHLFVNGRLRQENVFVDIASQRVVESYLYGEIHVDGLDNGDDIFTSNREGVIKDNDVYRKFLDALKRIQTTILIDWDKWRVSHRQDGDSEYTENMTKKERKANELINIIWNEYSFPTSSKNKKQIDNWIKEFNKDATFNVPAYTQCFILENLIRKYIDDNNIQLTTNVQNTANKFKEREKEAKYKGNISIDIRKDANYLNYLDMTELVKFVDSTGIENSLVNDSKEYKPIRDAIAHMAILTQEAQTKITAIYDNIKGRLDQLLSDIKE